jgi:hypothetical protein
MRESPPDFEGARRTQEQKALPVAGQSPRSETNGSATPRKSPRLTPPPPRIAPAPERLAPPPPRIAPLAPRLPELRQSFTYCIGTAERLATIIHLVADGQHKPARFLLRELIDHRRDERGE